jgi:K+-transporting ATPase KdpF subunit
MCISATGSSEGKDMSAESIVMLVISALTMIYLIYALLRPEKF